jgi:Cu/Zn superoxide dismutase
MKKLSLSFLVMVALLAVPMTASADSDSDVESKASLDGSQEVPPNGSAMTGKVKIEIEDGELQFKLKVRNNTNDIFAAHIHCAPPGVNGDIGVTLFMGSFTAAKGTLAKGTITAPDPGNGCGWADIAAVAAAIQSGTAYVNVHTTPASGGIQAGEIRGNLPADVDDDDDDDDDDD